MADILKESSLEVEPLSGHSAGAAMNGQYMAPRQDKDGKTWVRASALVQATPADLYALWRDVESAPQWQELIADVIVTGPKTSHWVMKTDGKTVEWDEEILADEPGRRIRWRTVAGDFDHAGEVFFEVTPGGRGTMVIVLQEFRQSMLTTAVQTLFCRNPRQAVIENLRHFKAFAETREFPRTHSQPHGPRGASGSFKASLYGEKIGVLAGKSAETRRMRGGR